MKTEAPRIYGKPDQHSDQTPPENGLRGERNGPRTGKGMPCKVAGVDGAPIVVEETSGVAAVEAAQAEDHARDE